MLLEVSELPEGFSRRRDSVAAAGGSGEGGVLLLLGLLPSRVCEIQFREWKKGCFPQSDSAKVSDSVSEWQWC